MQNSIIFPLFYMGPISYFSALKSFDSAVVLERYEHFPKQTFRNRCTIASPNGRLDLIVPVVKGSKSVLPYKDVRISKEWNWQRLHWLSLQNCYRSSAYFEYYEDELRVFYQHRFDFLFDFNLQLQEWIGGKLKLNTEILLSDGYYPNQYQSDFRDSFTKKIIPETETKPYFQVFDDKTGYLKNLSIIDLLFNQGPQSKHFL